MATLLVALDLSPASDAVVAAALTLAQATEARVVIVSVIQPPIMPGPYAATLLTNFDAIVDDAEKSAATRLAAIRRRFESAGVPAEVWQRRGGPAAEILSQARESRADYIVAGSHGHSALYDLIVGSTTQGILRDAPCPVVIVPPSAPRRKTSPRPSSARSRSLRRIRKKS